VLGRRLVHAVLLCGWVTALFAQPVQGVVEAIGFPAPTPAGYVVRAGQWFPVRVRFALQGTGLFTRELRLSSIDLDGDRVLFAHPHIALSSEGGEKSRHVWCYAVINALNELADHVDVLDEHGAAVDRILLPPCDLVAGDDLLILDLSEPKVTALDLLRSSGMAREDASESEGAYYRKVAVAKARPTDLPDSWLGLETVDVIVWDQPAAADLARTRQISALIEWVHNGGQLILGLGASWNAVQENAAISAILPMRGPGARAEVTALPTFQDRFCTRSTPSGASGKPIVLGWGELASDAVRTLGDVGPAGAIPLITMRPVGSGRVVATAAGLKDLTTAAGIDVPRFAAALLELARYSDSYLQKRSAARFGALLAEPLYLSELVTQPVGFGTATAARGFIALVFAVGYIGVATVGTWAWLTRRRRTHWSWPALAVCAAGASLLSLGTVRALRGVSGGVQSLCIVDFTAGERTARGPCWFGYRSPVRQVARFALPGEGNFLRPMARPPRDATYYVTAARFIGFPLKARLDDVLVRGTLKQFEGYWHGELDGTIRGDLVVNRRDGRLTPASWVLNELSANLEGAYLLFIDPRHDDGGVPRAVTLTRLPPLPENIAAEPDPRQIPPACNIVALPLGRIPAGARVDNLGATVYREIDRQWREWAAQEKRKRRDMPDLPTLWTAQHAWRGATAVATAEGPVLAILLASTRNYYGAIRPDVYDEVGLPVTLDGLPKLDITHWLLGGRTQGQAILIGWARRPGPARLQVNDRPRDAYAGLTVYRVRMPIRYTGQPPAIREEVVP